jgi:hypothetical protein
MQTENVAAMERCPSAIGLMVIIDEPLELGFEIWNGRRPLTLL